MKVIDPETGLWVEFPSEKEKVVSQQNVQTPKISTNPGQNQLVMNAGETIGEQYSLISATDQSDFETQLITLESVTRNAGYEIQGFRIPQFDTMMGKDSQIVGAVAGGKGDSNPDFKDVVMNFSTQMVNGAVPLQIQVRRLSDEVASKWVSIDQVTNGTAI